MAKIYTTDVGTKIKLDTGESLTGAVVVKIYARPPSGAVVELAATVAETTKVQHVKAATTLNLAGKWELQAYVEFADGTKYRGETASIQIDAPLE